MAGQATLHVDANNEVNHIIANPWIHQAVRRASTPIASAGSVLGNDSTAYSARGQCIRT